MKTKYDKCSQSVLHFKKMTEKQNPKYSSRTLAPSIFREFFLKQD